MPVLAVKNLINFFRPRSTVKLAMAPEVLAALLEKRQLQATDFRCLDLGSKQIVWKMFLTLAAARLKALAGAHPTQIS